MNQSIQFPEREEWNEAHQAICFPALVQGQLCTCAISATELRQRFGSNSEPVVLFQDNRWDLEDEAQRCIELQQDDDQGWFWVGAAR